MRFTKLNWILTGALFCANLAHANSGGGEAEGGGEGEAKAAAPKIPKDQKEFGEKTTKLATLSSRIAEADKQFAELVHKKNTAPSVEAKQAVIKEMNDLITKRNKDVEDHNRVKTDLTYRYPSQGLELDRKYQTQSPRSVDELEGAAGLDELLTRTKKIADQKFSTFNPKPKKPVFNKHGSEEPVDEKKPRLRIEK